MKQAHQFYEEPKPYCYYHKNMHIMYFCTNENCTLPLCKQCFLIHRKQHYSHKICQFAPLRESALRELSGQKCNIQEIVDFLEKQLTSYKQFLMQCFNKAYNQVLQKIQLMSLKKDITVLEQKIQVIKSGSLRRLILYLSQQKKHIPFPQEVNFLSLQQDITNTLASAFTVKKQRILTISDSALSRIKQVDTPKLINEQFSLSFRKDEFPKSRQETFAEQSKCSTIQIISESKISSKQSKFKTYHHKSASNLYKLRKSNSKAKGLTVCSSEKSLSFSHKQNNHNNEESVINHKLISNSTQKTWRNVVNMSQKKTRNLLKIEERPKTHLKLNSNKKTQDFLDYSQVLTPNQLRELCLNKNINSRKKTQSQNKLQPKQVLMKKCGVGEANKIKEFIYI